MPEPWAALSGLMFNGYEIRHGRGVATGPLREAIAGGLGYVQGPVLGSFVHGMFESPDVARALFGTSSSPTFDETFDFLADAIDGALHMETLRSALPGHLAPLGLR